MALRIPLKLSLCLGAALAGLTACSENLAAREVVEASAPQDVSVTLYRDPQRGEGDAMNRDWPRGFAMISETRTVTLPPGESTIRFDNVAEGMVAVSAIVTGLPGGTIEKNRNADLLSPAALVDGMLGNRVTITRSNPANGEAVSEDAIVRTRADGGLVLQTEQGYEAVRCSGLPEKLTFPEVPAGLSPNPVFTIDTQERSGGTYQVTLTYLAWGFDWQAHYVATLMGPDRKGKERFALRSWLSLLNDNGQSFENATLLAVAGTLNVESDFQGLAQPPRAAPLRLTCYPLGSTAAGSDFPVYDNELYPMPPPAPMAMAGADIMVTASRRKSEIVEAEAAMEAEEEDLGDLKLYRVPERVTVSAQSLKQIAFLDKGEATGELFYRLSCSPWEAGDWIRPLRMTLETTNDDDHGLGAALPMGEVTLFERSERGDLLIGQDWLRDHATGQDVEIELADSSQVMGRCEVVDESEKGGWQTIRLSITNANRWPVDLRVPLGRSGDWTFRKKPSKVAIRDGQYSLERRVAAESSLELEWQIRPAGYVEN